MKKSGPSGLRDYAGLLVRRRMWVILTFLACAGLTVLLALMVPQMFDSVTMIQIQPRDVPTEFVKDLITGTTDERLNSIEQLILSRTNLLKILDQFGDRLPEYRGLNDDRKVLKLQGRIDIQFPSERSRGQYLPITNLRIRYRDRNPELAQKITAQLASLFIEQDSKARENQIFGTTEFLQGELNKVAEQLKQSANNLKILKERFRYELPEEMQTNLRTLDRLQLQKTANVEALDRHLTLQMTLERQLSETPPMIYRDAPGRPAAAGAPLPDPKIQEYRKKEAEYKDLLVKATPSHPDVQRLKEELDRLKKEIPAEDLAAATAEQPAETQAMSPNPVYQSLTAQLSQIKTEIEIREKEKKTIDAEMARYNQRVANTPRIEQEMAAVLRANADLNKQHEDLKGKLEQAKLAESLESRQKGAQFVIVDPANFPLEPVSPPVPRTILIGLGLSLAAGIAMAWVVDRFNHRVWTHGELERMLEAPVLVEIPSMVSASDTARMRRTRLVQAAVLLVLAGVYAGGLYYLHLKETTVVRLLDPLIERMMK